MKKFNIFMLLFAYAKRLTFAIAPVFLFAIFFFLFAICSHAQAPHSFNYQLIARDTAGMVLSNRTLGIQISILKDSNAGIVVYSERHTSTSNNYGLVSLAIGTGSVVVGSFQPIDWGTHLHFVKLEIDPTGGTNYFAMGTSQLVSVPYALYAEKAGNVVDTSNTNELQALSISNDTLYLTNGGFVKLPAGTSSDWSRNGNNLYNNNSGNVGIGTNAPAGKFIVQGDSSAPATEPLFEVKNKEGDAVFIVYQDSVKVIIPKNASKATAQGGFAVSGRSSTKGETSNYLVITPDSARIYLDESSNKATAQGGFAVSGRSSSKGTESEYMSVNSDSMKVSKSLLIPRMTTYERDHLGFTPSEAQIIFNMTDECMQINKNGVWSNIWCFNCAPAIIIQPVDKTICSGDSTTFSVSLTGTNLVYQWQVSSNGGDTWSDILNGGTSPVYSGATSWNLLLTNVPDTCDGYKYRCSIISSCPPGAITNIVTLNVGSSSINFNSQPANQLFFSGCDVSFSIATSSFVFYQWQQSNDSGATWNTITDGGTVPVYSGANTSSVTLTNVPLAYDGYQYRCVVSNNCGANDNSNVATLTLNTLSVFTVHPADQQLSNTCAAGFSVTTAGSGMFYQWQQSSNGGVTWNNISDGGTGPVYFGATTSGLSLISVPLGYNGFKYRCIVSHFCRAPETSNSATLSAIAPTISVQPTDQQLATNCTAGFSITASGAGILYQWQQSSDGGSTWSNISNGGTAPVYSGATSPNLSLASVPMGYNGFKYRCVVSHPCLPASTSNAATLTVESMTITSQPVDQQLTTNCMAFFNITVSGSGMLYQWQQSSNGGATWNNLTNGGAGPVYSGVTTSNFSLSSVPMGYNGYKYRCIVSLLCQPSLTSNAATLTVVSPSITSQPSSQGTESGFNAGFNVTVSGGGISYQWQESSNGGTSWGNITNGGSAPSYSGASTPNLSLINVPIGYNGYKYKCVVSTSCSPNTVSDEATLSVAVCSSLSDIDGNSYNAVLIGSQCWMKENLKTTRNPSGGGVAYSDYDNTPSNSDTYGRLYDRNTSQGICPSGWHLPSDGEWGQLIGYLGGGGVAGGKMKEAGTAHWNSPNSGADNSSGFTALPGGYCCFSSLHVEGLWWSSSDYWYYDGDDWFLQGNSIYITNTSAGVTTLNWDLAGRFSVRCIRDF